MNLHNQGVITKGINCWSFPDGLLDKVHPIEAIRLAKEHRYEALELCIGDEGAALGLDASEAFCREIVTVAAAAQIKLPSTASGLYWGRSLGDDDPSVRSQAMSDLKRMLQISSWLGATSHLTIPGAVDVFFMPDRKPQDPQAVLARSKEGLKELLPVAESLGVRMGLENVWNKLFTSPTELMSFIDDFNSPFLGSYFDVGNVLPFGYPEQWIRLLGKRIVGVHFKDFRKSVGTADGFVDLLEGDVNWPAVMAALREIGYNGPVVAEMIPGYQHYPIVRVANTSVAMDAILGR